jgi:hypothetical protein
VVSAVSLVWAGALVLGAPTVSTEPPPMSVGTLAARGRGRGDKRARHECRG